MGGGGSTYDYGFRIYNPQLAKFLSVDPLTKSYPWYTPYQFAGNTPIQAIDLDGAEPKSVITPDGNFTKAASTLLSELTITDYARISNVNIHKGWIPLYEDTKGGGAMTISNTIKYTHQFFDGGASDNPIDWLRLSSHEVVHLWQYDKQHGNPITYLLDIGGQYVGNWGHDGAPYEMQADEGMKSFDSFAMNIGGGSYSKGTARIAAIFNNNELSDEERTDGILDLLLEDTRLNREKLYNELQNIDDKDPDFYSKSGVVNNKIKAQNEREENLESKKSYNQKSDKKE